MILNYILILNSYLRVVDKNVIFFFYNDYNVYILLEVLNVIDCLVDGIIGINNKFIFLIN